MRLTLLRHAILVLIVGSTPTVMAATDHSHAHEPSGALQLQLDQGEKWQTDAPLRASMDAVREALLARLPAIHDGTLPAAEYDALAGVVRGRVDYMIRNCELPPDADAQLHAVIASLLQAAETMQTAQDPRRGAVQTVRTLKAYGEHFAHEGWQPIAH